MNRFERGLMIAVPVEVEKTARALFPWEIQVLPSGSQICALVGQLLLVSLSQVGEKLIHRNGRTEIVALHIVCAMLG